MIILFAVYRPPSANPDFLYKLYDHVSLFQNNKLIIAGDFNLPDLDWVDLPTNRSLSSDIILDMMLCCDLSQLVKSFTREEGCSGSILDLVFVSNVLPDFNVDIKEGISDHKLVAFSCSVFHEFHYKKDRFAFVFAHQVSSKYR